MPQFPLRSLFVVIAFIAVSITALVQPSVYWSLAMPPVATAICVFGVYEAIASPRVRALWTSFIAGLVVYWLVLMSVRPFFMYDGRWDVWQVYFGAPVWQLIHGEVPRTKIINGNSLFDFISFLLSLHFICAILISGIAALIVHSFSARGTNH
jgi:hypothetical protein